MQAHAELALAEVPQDAAGAEEAAAAAAPAADDVVIRVRGLSKCYLIYDRPQDRLKQALVPRLRRLLGRPSRSYYREFWALRDVSFEVRRGETVGIIGRNGSGKSTLLQILCGTLFPNAGSVEVRGRVAALLELGSGFNPEFTGRENVYLYASVLGLSRAEVDARFDAIAAFADIGDFIDQPLKTYSSGMHVRLAFAVAVCVDPDILVVDEALAVGDLRFQLKCLRRMRELKDRGCSILFVSHAPGVVEALCDRAIWLEQGKLHREGPPSEVVRRYVSFMNHGIEETDHHKEATFADLNTSSADDSDWEWVDTSRSRNVRARPNCSITRIRLLVNGERNPTTIACAPAQVRFEFQVVSNHIIELPLVGFGVFNALDEPVIHFNSHQIQRFCTPISARRPHTVCVEASLPPLRPGEYFFAIGVDDGPLGAHELVCHVHDAWHFRVALAPGRAPQAGYIQTEAAAIWVVE